MEGTSRYQERSGCSAFGPSARENEDWTKLTDVVARRKLQNRIAQRNYRRSIKRRLEDLDRINSVALTYASAPQNYKHDNLFMTEETSRVYKSPYPQKARDPEFAIPSPPLSTSQLSSPKIQSPPLEVTDTSCSQQQISTLPIHFEENICMQQDCFQQETNIILGKGSWLTCGAGLSFQGQSPNDILINDFDGSLALDNMDIDCGEFLSNRASHVCLFP